MRQINTAACGTVLLATFVFGAQASLGAVAYVPDNGVALTPYYAIASGQDLGPQSFAGFGFALDYIHVNSNEWNSAGATVALDVSVVVTASGISVFFSATAAASSPGIARGAYEIDFGIRITNNHELAFDTLIVGGGISEFRPSLLPNGASVDDVAAASARFVSSISGPYMGGTGGLDPYVGEMACDTADASGDRGPIFRNGNGNGVHCSVITPDFADVTLYIVDFLPGDSVLLNYSSRLYVEAMRVPAPAGVWVMLLGLAAVIPLRRRG
jgi:hypothetical protein